MRKEYGETEDNPFEQSYDYIRKIRGGHVLDKELVDVDPSTPFYVYVICDMTNTAVNLQGTLILIEFCSAQAHARNRAQQLDEIFEKPRLLDGSLSAHSIKMALS